MNDREVADYLLAHPEFFIRHAELLATIQFENPHGKAAISLQERQMKLLREKNKQLERRLAELLHYGHENDDLMSKFNRWITRVIAERDPHALPRAITNGLADVFDVPRAALRLWNVAEAHTQADFARYVSEEIRLFTNSLATPYCGINTGFEAAQWLTSAAPASDYDTKHLGSDNSDSPTESIALIALTSPQLKSQDGAFGLLVLGSPDARRFHDSMATDFLTHIGTLTSAALTRLLPHH